MVRGCCSWYELPSHYIKKRGPPESWKGFSQTVSKKKKNPQWIPAIPGVDCNGHFGCPLVFPLWGSNVPEKAAADSSLRSLSSALTFNWRELPIPRPCQYPMTKRRGASQRTQTVYIQVVNTHIIIHAFNNETPRVQTWFSRCPSQTSWGLQGWVSVQDPAFPSFNIWPEAPLLLLLASQEQEF